MKKTPKNFEEALTKLEKITQQMQSGELALEDALKQYEEGRELVHFCQTKLDEVGQKLQQLDVNNELTELHLEQSQ